jgi:hypothetical protein
MRGKDTMELAAEAKSHALANSLRPDSISAVLKSFMRISLPFHGVAAQQSSRTGNFT